MDTQKFHRGIGSEELSVPPAWRTRQRLEKCPGRRNSPARLPLYRSKSDLMPSQAPGSSPPLYLLRVLGKDGVKSKHLGDWCCGGVPEACTAWGPSSGVIQSHLLLARIHLQEGCGLRGALDSLCWPYAQHNFHLGVGRSRHLSSTLHPAGH